MENEDTKASLLILGSLLVCHADDLHFVGLDGAVVVELEVDVFDQEGPDIVAEAVGVEGALEEPQGQLKPSSLCPRGMMWMH